MRKWANICASLLLCCFASVATAKEQEKSFPDWYVEAFVAPHSMPGFLLGFEADEHPGSIDGLAQGLRLGRSFNKHYSLGVEFFHTELSGSGPWTKKDEMAQYRVTGTSTGSVNMRIYGVGIEAERRFFILDNLIWYIRLGPLGVGFLNGEADVVFRGHSIDYPDVKIEEPGHEGFHRLIPLVGVGTGVEWRVTDNVSLAAGPFWNTGFGGEASLIWRFDF